MQPAPVTKGVMGDAVGSPAFISPLEPVWDLGDGDAG